jgi:NDP-sugar pyrophosphorylase family protein|tara:strand:+ start:11203 stop:12732 length:1530 start_codon:yes stop_codon:yes gene_type:complete
MAGHSRRFKVAGHKKPKFMLKCGDRLMIEHVFNMFSEQDEYHLILNNSYENDEDIRTFLINIAPNVSLYFIKPHEDGPTVSILNAKLNLNRDSPIIVSYCDFTVEWDYDRFKREVITHDSSAPYFIGFQAASLGHTKYAYMTKNDSLMVELREKESFTDNRIDEPASTGIYYFKSYIFFEELAGELLSKEIKLQNGESYVSLLMNEVVKQDKNVFLFKVNKFICLGTPEDFNQFNYWHEHFSIMQVSDPYIFADYSMFPMAGEGSRFKKIGYRTSKPVIQIGGESLIEKCISSLPKSKNEIFLLSEKNYKNKNIIEKISKANNHSNKVFISVNEMTEGQASTCLLARDQIDDNSSLMISSCDYEINYDTYDLQKIRSDYDPDVIIFTFKLGSQPVGSYENFGYCVEESGLVSKIVEKQCISEEPMNDHMITGTFWYKEAKDFKDASDHLIKENIRINNEFYVGTSINHLIDNGLKVYCFEVKKWISFGDPVELDLYYFWEDYFNQDPLY